MRTGSISQDPSRSVLMAGGLLLLSLCFLGLLLEAEYPSLLNFAYPGVVFLIGGWLYISHPPLYLGFTWWIWFITPFMRRVADYQVGELTLNSPIMLAPFLVTGWSFFSLLRFGKRLQNRVYAPFMLSLLGVVYGFAIGIIRVGPLSATYGLLQWMLPLFFGFHLMLFWRLYPAHRRVIRSTFTWGVLLMGIYGVIQYTMGPPWDMLWLLESGMGQPEPYQFRVFSTLNSTGPFANIMMVGLLLLFDGRGLLPRLAAIPGYASFLFSLVRSAWGGWMIGLAFIANQLEGKLRVRLFALLATGLVLTIPILIYTPNTQRLTDRAETFTNLDDDGSLNARMKLYRSTTLEALLSPVGNGIGSLGGAARLSTGDRVSFDSGVLAIPYIFGWPGTLLYLGGLIWMIVNALQIRKTETDQFAVIAVAIVLAFMAMMVFHNHLKGLSGTAIWTFLALALAAKQYYEQSEDVATAAVSGTASSR